MFAIAKFISDLFGRDLQKVQRWVLIVLIGLFALVLLSVVLWTRSCWNGHKLKVSQAQVEKINKANAEERKAELQKVVDENTDVVKTVDNRTTMTDANVWERNRAADQRVNDAEKAIDAAHAQGRDVTQEELQCLLVPTDCQ